MDFDILYQKIKEYDRIMIFGHTRPDGDCYGSLNGLKNIITTTYPDKQVFCLTSKVELLEFVGMMDDVDDSYFKDALAICCDTATRERVQDQRYKLCKEIIKFDHHVIIDNYGDYNIVDEFAPATCLLIAKFFFAYEDLKMTPVGATALYTGIVTDTSNFRQRGVDYDTFKYAGKLVQCGADVAYIDKMLSIVNLRTTKMKAYVYRHLKVTKEGVCYAKLNKTIIKLYNISYDEAAGLVSLLANIKECPVWILFIGYPKEIRVRIRSNGPDINNLAELYGGGGHQKAAGATIYHWIDTIKFIKEANYLLKCYKDNVPYVSKKDKKK